MNKHWIVYMAALTCMLGRADLVELKDGTRIEGRILAENKNSIEIEVGANAAGTIRRVLIIHSSEISTWMADEEGRVATSNDEKVVKRLAGRDYVERLLRQAEADFNEKKYDEAIDGFQHAADIASKNLDSMEPENKVDALNHRAHALRLMLAALEGKQELLENRSEGLVDDFEDHKDRLKREWDQLELDKEDLGENRTQLGRHQERNKNKDREKALRAEIELLNAREKAVIARSSMLEEEAVLTKAKIELVEERVEQAENDAEQAERELRRR